MNTNDYTVRFRADWYWCERRNDDNTYTYEFVQSPNRDDWDYVSPVLWIDDPEWTNTTGGGKDNRPGPM